MVRRQENQGWCPTLGCVLTAVKWKESLGSDLWGAKIFFPYFLKNERKKITLSFSTYTLYIIFSTLLKNWKDHLLRHEENCALLQELPDNDFFFLTYSKLWMFNAQRLICLVCTSETLITVNGIKWSIPSKNGLALFFCLVLFFFTVVVKTHNIRSVVLAKFWVYNKLLLIIGPTLCLRSQNLLTLHK